MAPTNMGAEIKIMYQSTWTKDEMCFQKSKMISAPQSKPIPRYAKKYQIDNGRCRHARNAQSAAARKKSGDH